MKRNENSIIELMRDSKMIQDQIKMKVSMADINRIEKQQKMLATKESLRVLGTRFSKYASNENMNELKSRLEIVHSNIDKKIERVVDQNRSFITKNVIEDYVESNNQSIESLNQEIQKIHNQAKSVSKLKQTLDNISKKLTCKIDQSAHSADITEIWKKFATFNQFIEYSHLQDHIDKVEPLVKKCKQELIQFREDNQEAKLILQRFDEVLSEKASKFSLQEVSAQSATFWLKSEINDLRNHINFRIRETELYVDRVNGEVQTVQEDTQSVVAQAVDALQMDLKSKIKLFLETRSIDPRELNQMLFAKADKCDILNLENKKADRSEIEANMKWVNWIKDKPNPEEKPLVSSRLDRSSLDAEDYGKLIQIRPFTTKMEKTFWKITKDHKQFEQPTFRSTSTKRADRPESILSCYKQSHINSIAKAKRQVAAKRHCISQNTSIDLSQLHALNHSKKLSNIQNWILPNSKLPSTNRLVNFQSENQKNKILKSSKNIQKS